MPEDRVKTSVYLRRPLLRAVKTWAAAQGKKEYEVFEEALGRYLAMEAVRRNWERPDAPSEEEAMQLAIEAIKEVRSMPKTPEPPALSA